MSPLLGGGPPASKGEIRRLVDIGKLNKGR